ncbi:cupin domain-containing protein [Actinomadura madurae]|uniref:Cupin domain-containing protein n=1 Tax=Actinomadura madurae TaxID=1993 RepID=A0A1I5RHB5_9ACTN|nr:cupin domain-containing protein [Actinomadura madurae]SFP57964.1 Cupin domain-containing protein [Actinomadura madurae]
MAVSGPDFTMADFLAGFAHVVRPGGQRPLVVHDDDLETIPAGSVPNPTTLRIAGTLPTTTFELFRQVIPPGASSDMQRHYHETVHFVISGEGHSLIEGDGGADGETVAWTAGSFVYTPPWAWHRHYNDSSEHPVEFLTIENSRLLGLFGLVRRESAGLATLQEARDRFDQTEET